MWSLMQIGYVTIHVSHTEEQASKCDFWKDMSKNSHFGLLDMSVSVLDMPLRIPLSLLTYVLQAGHPCRVKSLNNSEKSS